ncbi:MAG: hypothetical protein ACK550_04000, partial [Synechococcaceae cyanobacterium]
LKAPFDLSELTGPNPTGPIVYDRPLFNSASPNDALLAAGRDFLAQLFHLSTAVDVVGEPIVGVIAGESLAPWLEAFAASLTSPVLLRDDSTDDQIDASLVRRRTLLSGSTLLSELQASPAALAAPDAAIETAAFSAPESISTTKQIAGIGVGSEVINSVEIYKNLIPISGLETIQIPTDLFPSFKLNLGLLAAMNDQRLSQLLASPPAVDLVEESFAAALPAPLRTQTISATSAIKTTTNTELLWDVEPSSTKNGQLLGYQEAAKVGPGNYARITSDQQVVISSPVLGFTGDEAVAYGEFPRLEMAVVGQSGGPSNVYSAYWLPSAKQDSSGFQWLIENQDQFNDRSPETGGAANPRASMLTIALPAPLDVARISLELAAVPGQPNGGQPVLRSHLFKVNQYRKKSVGVDNPLLTDIKLAGFDAGDYEIVDSRVVNLNGDQTYIDNYAGAVDFISFTPYFEIGSFDGKTSGYSVETFLTPLLNGASGVGLQLSIDDVLIRNTTSTPENHALHYSTYVLPGSELQVAAYQGSQVNGAAVGTASLASANGALSVAVNTMPVLPNPLLTLSKRSGEAFSLNDISFSPASTGSYRAQITYYDGRVEEVTLNFGSSAITPGQLTPLASDASQTAVATASTSPTLSTPAGLARQALLAALDGPGQSIAFRSTATSGFLNQQLSILDVALATALGEAPVNLTRDLRNATLEAMGPLPSEATLHLDTAVLKGLTSARVALEDLAVFLGNASTSSLSSDLASTAKSFSFASQAAVADLSGRSLAELIAIGRSDRLDGQPVLAPAFSPAELAELLKRDLILKPTDIGLIDDIHTLDETVRVLLRPLESPLEVLRNTNPLPPLPVQPPLLLAEGSLFPDATLAAFGDVDLGGPISDLYLGGERAGMINYDPVFALPGDAAGFRSTLPSLAMVTLHDAIHPLDLSGLQLATLNPSGTRRNPLLPAPLQLPLGSGFDFGNTVAYREFSLAQLIGTPILGRTYQIQAVAAFRADLDGDGVATPLALRLQILDSRNRLIDRLQDTDNTLNPGQRTDADVLTFTWSEKLANARLRVAPALNFADGTSLAAAQAQLGDSAFRLQVGILDTPALAEGSATWADIDNDGDVDLLLSGEDADTGLLTTQLLRNPLVGGGSGFERLSIALPGLKRAVASWGDVDLDGDLDLAVSGVQGSAERPYLQIFRNTTSQRLSDPGEGEPPFAGILNR